MRRVQLALLATVALVIVIAVAASASPSQPEWFKRGAPIGEATTVPFTGKSIAGTPELESTLGHKVVCEASTSTGEISGPRQIKNTKVTYHGCKEGTASCKSSGQTEGNIATNKLTGENVYLDGAHKKTAVLLKPASGNKFASFKCGSSEVQVTGALLAQSSPTNEGDSTIGELQFAQEGGHQQWQQVEEAGEKQHVTAFLVEAGVGGGATVSSVLTEEDKFASAVELHRS